MRGGSSRGLPFAPWHTPKERQYAPGVYVTTVYGSHALAALVYAGWQKVRGRLGGEAGKEKRDA